MQDLVNEAAAAYEKLRAIYETKEARKKLKEQLPEVNAFMAAEMASRHKDKKFNAPKLSKDESNLAKGYISALNKIDRHYNQQPLQLPANGNLSQIEIMAAQIEVMSRMIAQLQAQPAQATPEPMPEWKGLYVTYSLNGRRGAPGDENGYRINCREHVEKHIGRQMAYSSKHLSESRAARLADFINELVYTVVNAGNE